MKFISTILICLLSFSMGFAQNEFSFENELFNKISNKCYGLKISCNQNECDTIIHPFEQILCIGKLNNEKFKNKNEYLIYTDWFHLLLDRESAEEIYMKSSSSPIFIFQSKLGKDKYLIRYFNESNDNSMILSIKNYGFDIESEEKNEHYFKQIYEITDFRN